MSDDDVRNFARVITGRSQPEPAPIDPEVLAEKLRDALVLWQSPHAFKAGDVIRHRPGIISVDSSALRLIIVAVYLNATLGTPADMSLPPGQRADLLLAYYDQDDDFTLGYADSRKYEPAT
jgi:hypothetical protein